MKPYQKVIINFIGPAGSGKSTSCGIIRGKLLREGLAAHFEYGNCLHVAAAGFFGQGVSVFAGPEKEKVPEGHPFGESPRDFMIALGAWINNRYGQGQYGTIAELFHYGLRTSIAHSGDPKVFLIAGMRRQVEYEKLKELCAELDCRLFTVKLSRKQEEIPDIANDPKCPIDAYISNNGTLEELANVLEDLVDSLGEIALQEATNRE